MSFPSDFPLCYILPHEFTNSDKGKMRERKPCKTVQHKIKMTFKRNTAYGHYINAILDWKSAIMCIHICSPFMPS